jgi:hypothetical protein
MRALIRKYWRRALFALGELVAVLLLLLLILAAVMVWRLKTGPVDISFANEYIKTAIHDYDQNIHVDVGSVELYWPELTGPIQLGLGNGRISGADAKEIAYFEEISVSLSRTKLLLGQIAPRSITIVRPYIRVVRYEDNRFDFGLATAETVADEELAEQSDQQKGLALALIAAIEQPPSRRSQGVLSSLRSFEIERAQVIVEDYGFGATWFIPSFNFEMQRGRRGLQANFGLSFPPIKGEPSSLNLEVVYDRSQERFDVGAIVQNFDIQILGAKLEEFERLRGQDIVLSGEISAMLEQDFTLRSADLSLFSKEGSLQIVELSPDPVAISGLELLAHYEMSEDEGESLHIEKAQFKLEDVPIAAEGLIKSRINPETLVSQGYEGAVSLAISDIHHDQLKPVWPAILEGDSAEEWIIDKMSGGDLSGLKADMSFTLQKEAMSEQSAQENEPVEEKTEAQTNIEADIETETESPVWAFDIESLEAHFAFSDMVMDYRAPLPALKNANGIGVLTLPADTLQIDISNGKISSLDIKSASLKFTDVVAEGKGAVAMEIALSGPLQDVFEYISTEPIDLKDELDMDVSQVRGHADLQVKLDFPTKDDLLIEEINMDIRGKVSDGFLPDVLRGLPLSGGPFDVVVNNDYYAVSGSGALAARPVEFEWKEFLDSQGKAFRHQAKAKITVDEELRRVFGVDLSDFFEGDLPAEITYTGLQGGRAEADIAIDIAPAIFKIEPFEYIKPSGASGSATLKAHLQNDELIRISDLNGQADNFRLDNGTIDFVGTGENTRPSRVDIGALVINETNGILKINYADSGAMDVTLHGDFLDLRPFLNASDNEVSKPYDNPPMRLDILANRMRTADEEIVRNAIIKSDIDGEGRFNRMEADFIAGQGRVFLRYGAHQSGERAFTFEAEDAGAVLRAFDVYNNIIGGRLVINGTPLENIYDRNIGGTAVMTDFKVVRAPALARLIGALSLPGVLQLLNSDGLSFSRLEADFEWRYRPQGAMLMFKDGRTSGNSVGFTFDGSFDRAQETVDVSGTVIPLSGINRAIGSIPIIGTILTGGTGAIIAATYTMRGNFEEPVTSVNPLSVLTPGILRRILFEN